MKTQPLLLMLVVAVTMNTQAASFNCAKASTFVEKEICHVKRHQELTPWRHEELTP